MCADAHPSLECWLDADGALSFGGMKYEYFRVKFERDALLDSLQCPLRSPERLQGDTLDSVVRELGLCLEESASDHVSQLFWSERCALVRTNDEGWLWRK